MPVRLLMLWLKRWRHEQQPNFLSVHLGAHPDLFCCRQMVGRTMKIYIAGPMTGLPDLNRSAFERAKQALDAEGHNAVNPHDLHPTDVQWHTAMRTDIMELLTCDAVALLDNWQNSRGALLEHFIASTLGVPCKPLSDYVAEAYR